MGNRNLMSRIENLSPDPKSHVKTLMRIGYTLYSAVADIIDNSITAKSKNIEIYAPPGLSAPLISILDDGYGMDTDELIQSMRIGCFCWLCPLRHSGDGIFLEICGMPMLIIVHRGFPQIYYLCGPWNPDLKTIALLKNCQPQ